MSTKGFRTSKAHKHFLMTHNFHQGVRLTAFPQMIEWNLIETVVNTLAKQVMQTGVAQVGSGKILGMEIMKAQYNIDESSREFAQSNNVQVGISTKDDLAIIPGQSAQETIFADDSPFAVSDGATTSQLVNQQASLREIDLTDGDGNGRLILSTDLTAYILGTGNASVKKWEGKLYYHLVEMDAIEALPLLLDSQ